MIMLQNQPFNANKLRSDIYKYSLSSLSSKNYIVRLHNISSNL